MEQIKKLLGETVVKLKIIIGIVLAGLIVGVAAWRKHVQDEWAKQDKEKEIEIVNNAGQKLDDGKKKIDEDKKVEETKIDTDAKAKQADLDKKKDKDAEKLKKGSSAEVKKAAAETLGLKEGKKKGRPKK